jgi:hypothetical protein
MAVQLLADGNLIELNSFVEGYLYNIVKGIGASLRGTNKARRLELNVEGMDITFLADGKEVPLGLGKGFAKLVVTDTIAAVIKHLKRADRAKKIRICVDL